MATTRTVAILVGSLTRSAVRARTLSSGSRPASLKFQIVELGELPLYNQDLDTATPPAAWTSFRQQIKAADAVLFVTPEYNRSVPGALKNALDVGSRSQGQSAWDGKPGAVVSESPGALGAFGANHHLPQSLVFLNVPTMQQPEAYIGGAGNLFNADGQLTNESTRDLFRRVIRKPQWRALIGDDSFGRMRRTATDRSIRARVS